MLLLLSGCYQTVLTYECETVTVEVADDEVANDLDVTADEVLEVVVGGFPFAAEYETGGEVAGLAEVARGAGPAIAIDRALLPVESRGELGFGTSQWTGHPPCDDALEVPVEVEVTTEDGAVSFAQATMAFTLPGSSRLEVGGELDAGAALPAPSDPAAVAGFALQWTPDGFDHVSLWWRGDAYEQVLETPSQ